MLEWMRLAVPQEGLVSSRNRVLRDCREIPVSSVAVEPEAPAVKSEVHHEPKPLDPKPPDTQLPKWLPSNNSNKRLTHVCSASIAAVNSTMTRTKGIFLFTLTEQNKEESVQKCGYEQAKFTI